ncbi:hypothetical protein ACIRUL_31785 [Streptomyces sp. NPDC101171]|uniref:hypothetical protein n=1 Tax=Streptomyces sp. NPDC101171 TaxID=3366122 RepID=UPI003816F185
MPAEPAVPVESAVPAVPAEPAVPVESAVPAVPAEADVAVESAAPAAPAAPAVPAEPAAPVEPAAHPLPESVQGGGGRTGRRRIRVSVVAGCVLLAGALVAGVGHTVVTVRAADRGAGPPLWRFPRTAADEKKAEPRHGLAGMLVPYGTGTWVPGPDIGEFGADAELTGAQATALRKRSVSGLPRTTRKEMERQIDRQHITGMAMRSYFSAQSQPYLWNEEVYAVSITLSRMGDESAARRISTSTNKIVQELGALRAGPAVKGHEDAKCFRSPKGSGEGVNGMFCSAYVGDVLVTITASGAKTLDGDGVAKLLATQLDRIAEPGAAV